MNRRRNLFIVIGALVVIVAIAVIVSAKSGHQAISARIVTIAPGRFTTRLPETGTVQRPQTQTLPALVSGNIAAISARPGDHVVAGQVLVTLTNPQLVNAALDAHQAYLSAASRAASTERTGTSAVVQAEANLESARFRLNQAYADQKAGTQSGLGYGFSSAQEERANADAAVANADTNLHEAQRIYDADKNLYDNKAISKDALDQQAARLAQAKVADDQARTQREATFAQLGRQNVGLARQRARRARQRPPSPGRAGRRARQRRGRQPGRRGSGPRRRRATPGRRSLRARSGGAADHSCTVQRCGADDRKSAG